MSPVVKIIFLINFSLLLLQASFTCALIWPNTSPSISSATFCASQKNATLEAASKSASQTTASGLCAMNPAATSSAAIPKNSLALPKFPVKPNTGRFILLHARRSTYVRSVANASLTYRRLRMKFTLIRTFRGEKTRCSRWSSEPMRMEDTRCTRVITSKLKA